MDSKNRKLKEDIPNIREGAPVRFDEVCDRPIIIVDRETRLSKPDVMGKKNPYVVWLVDIGHELVYTYPNGNTDAILRSWLSAHPGEQCKVVISALPNPAGYMRYVWYDWDDDDMANFMAVKGNPVNPTPSLEDAVPF